MLPNSIVYIAGGEMKLPNMLRHLSTDKIHDLFRSET